ncbi:MAG: membrane protein insertion efficiency factor YidD [Candidatus Rhabdochlamydia sp.]
MLFRLLLLFFPFYVYAMPGYFEPWGKDADLIFPPPKKIETTSSSLPVCIAEKIIWFHQHVLSPVDGPRSHFYPSSSSYMKQAMQKHGFILGFFMGCDRLQRENSDPWVYRTIEIDQKLIKYNPVPYAK